MTLNLEKDDLCFGCGQENPYGLKLRVVKDGKKQVKAEMIAKERYRGWSKYLHGGILSLVFDELLGWMSRYMGYDAMTARLGVRYRKPVPLGAKLTFSGVLERETKGILDIKTVAYLEDGSVAAEGEGRMMIIQARK